MRRLASHASLAVFGGNNENEAMLNWQQETITYRDRYLVDYNELYINTVRDALVREVSTHVEFQASSPTNGPYSLEPYTLIWGDAYNDTMGDNHWYDCALVLVTASSPSSLTDSHRGCVSPLCRRPIRYDYGVDCSEATAFPRSRYISESAFRAFPLSSRGGALVRRTTGRIVPTSVSTVSTTTGGRIRWRRRSACTFYSLTALGCNCSMIRFFDPNPTGVLLLHGDTQLEAHQG